MTVHELNREQLIQLKQQYLCQLAEEGCYAEVRGVPYDEPSYGDLADADEIVSDDVIFRNYDDVYFTEEDFV